ncbi:MAG: ramA1 [Anaerocolumna sp.]|jgi:alpha-L-rhamnosidase|nr:ramA1 [Anaerocolumna sp.]
MLKITKLRVNHLENPIGFKLKGLSFSWITESSDSKTQTAAQIIIATDEYFNNVVYDSGKDETANSVSFMVELELAPRTRYFWRVQVWDELGNEALSDVAFFETGKLDEPWQGKWISPNTKENNHPVLRKLFHTNKKVVSARAYVAGLGLYEFYMNGEKVGNEYLSPGFHSYDFRVQYQTYDVTKYLDQGENAIGVMMGPGWFKGRIGFDGGYTNLYGDDYYFICELHVLFTDGSNEIVSTDESWKSEISPVVFSGIYDGEVYDARLELDGFSKTDFDESTWKPVRLSSDLRFGPLEERTSLPVVVIEERKPVKLIKTPKDEWVLDFGQIMTGWVSCKVNVKLGEEIKLTYGEIMQDECFYRENLRSAKAEFTYISGGEETLIRPHFTFYGFRYVKIEGFQEPIDTNSFTACVLMSEMEQIGTIETGNKAVNQLFQNALWSQKGNFLDVPTDCPQRDERLGWTGDAQIFSGTACFNTYSPAFFTKYMEDVNLEQSILDGSVPHTVPRLKPIPSNGFIDGHGASPWADVAVIIPWNLYLHYGDKNLLNNQYAGMKAWVDYCIKRDNADGGDKLIKSGFHFADWLGLDNYEDPNSYFGGTDPYYVASAFYYYSTNILSMAAEILGKTDDVKFYESQKDEIKKAIQREYFSPSGRSTIMTQTALVLAIFMDLVPEEQLQRCIKDLLNLIEKKNMHLDTGFVGTPFICRALSKMKCDDYAYHLLLNDDFPSWLYEVKMGATTIWERWNSVLEDGSISGTGMNSLNHYAYGSIVEWLYRDTCGFNPVMNKPGFKEIRIAPHPTNRLKRAKTVLKSSAGTYLSEWEVLGDGRLKFEIQVPFDAKATVLLPDADLNNVMINEKNAEGIQLDGFVEVTLYTGNYTIIYMPVKDYIAKFNLYVSLYKVLEHKEACGVLKQFVGEALKKEQQIVEDMKKHPLKKFLTNYQLFQYFNPEIIGTIEKELSKIVMPN